MYSTPQPMYGAPRPMDGRYSPNPAMSGRLSPNPGRRSPNPAGFEVEHVSRPPSAIGNRIPPPPEASYDPEFVYRENVSKLIAAKNKPFSVSGRIPSDPSHLVLFFRSKTGTSHSLDFPIDINYNSPPALDVLIAACKRHQVPGYETTLYESYYYPSNLPLTPSLEIANFPILDAVHTALFPHLPPGQHLTVKRDHVDILLAGGRLAPTPRALRNDGRIATLSITLPVRFTGGALIVRDPVDGRAERLESAAPTADIEWTAFLGECDYEVDTVTKGCRMSISYAVFARSFGGGAPGPGLASPNPAFGMGGMPGSIPGQGLDGPALFAPSQPFLDLLPPVLQMSRGRKLAFLLAHDYDVDPSIVPADAIVPQLKGGDALIYNALKAFKLTPALHWTAGGFVWPVERPVEIFDEEPGSASGLPGSASTPAYASRFGGTHQTASPYGAGAGQPYASPNQPYGSPNLPPQSPYGAMGGAGAPPLPPAEALRARVQASGAIPLEAADITLLTDWRAPADAQVGKARVHFVASGLLEKLVLNVLVVVYVL